MIFPDTSPHPGKKNMPNSQLAAAELTIGLNEAAQEIGFDIRKAMSQTGLNPVLLEEPRGYITWEGFSELLELVTEQSGCGYFGMLVARHQPAMELGVLGQIMKFCPDVGTALAKGHEYNSIYNHSVFWETRRNGDTAALTRHFRYQRKRSLTQITVLGITQVFKLLNGLCGPGWKPASITLCQSEPDPKTRNEYRALFNTPIRYGQENDSIVFPIEDLARPISSSDRRLLAIVEEHARGLRDSFSIDNDVSTNTRLFIRQTLGQGGASMDNIAGMLNLHPKALHRRLKNEGQTFKKLVNEERLNEAQYYLTTRPQMPLAQLAELLGYSNPAPLSRAFRKRYGVAPSTWRDQQLRKTEATESGSDRN